MPSYTLEELIELMEPQTQRDKALISGCIAGLSLYAAQCAQANQSSSKIDDMRKLVENLVGYWGLDDGDHAPPLEDFLQAFDEQIHSAKFGEDVIIVTDHCKMETIYGLHRFGEEMVVAQGEDAMSEILDAGDLMKEIALHWEFEPFDIVENLAERLRAEVRTMLAAIPLPGQPDNDVKNGYKLSQAILFNTDRGFALAHNPNAPAPFVTWQFTNEDGNRSYYWGHYMATEERARIDYISRVTDYRESYIVSEKPIPTAAAEMSTEQNHNMIDGVRNNEAPAELLRSEGRPLVTVTFSEHDRLRGVERMPIHLADALFAELDAKPGADGAPYYKTDFCVEYIINGKPDRYGGHYDVGDGDGSLIDHIESYAKHNLLDEDYQKILADKGGDWQEVINSQIVFNKDELVPFFRKHCELSQKEDAAVSELKEIQNAAEGAPSDTAKVRIEYLEAVLRHCSRSRDELNGTLPDSPHHTQPVGEGAKDQSDHGEKASVLEQIRTARTAPSVPKDRTTRQNKKDKGGTEL